MIYKKGIKLQANSARIQSLPAKFLAAGHDEVNERSCPESMF